MFRRSQTDTDERQAEIESSPCAYYQQSDHGGDGTACGLEFPLAARCRYAMVFTLPFPYHLSDDWRAEIARPALQRGAINQCAHGERYDANTFALFDAERLDPMGL